MITAGSRTGIEHSPPHGVAHCVDESLGVGPRLAVHREEIRCGIIRRRDEDTILRRRPRIDDVAAGQLPVRATRDELAAAQDTSRYRKLPAADAVDRALRLCPGAIRSESFRSPPSPRTMSVSGSRLVIATSTLVPTGTRISGAGIWGARPTSANVAAILNGPSSASGYHAASCATSRSDHTPSRSVPLATRLSLGVARTPAAAGRRAAP